LAQNIIPASFYDTNYFPYLTIAIYHTKDPIKKVYADKGYYRGVQNSFFIFE